MPNVGLRAYLWNHQKDRQQRVSRELWLLNGATYHAFRQYTSHVKDNGFPEQRRNSLAMDGRGLPRGRHPTLDTRLSLATQGSMASRQGSGRSFTFAGMKHIFDQGVARAVVVRFGCNSSDLLAWAGIDGAVHIATLTEPPKVLHDLCQHKRPVCDIDWSPDNLLLASAADDGGVCLWRAEDGALLRTFMLGKGATCCKFLFGNANFLVVGTISGELHLLNSSTARTQECVKLAARGPHKDLGGVCCLAISTDLIFVASTSGSILVYKVVMRMGMLQPLQALFRTLPPSRKMAKHFEAASMVYSPYTCLAGGPALLVSLSSCHLCVLRVTEATGVLEGIIKAPVPRAARPIKATFCPTEDITEPEYIAMGGEDTGVYVYDVSKPEARYTQQVISSLQGHMAPVVDVSWSADDMLLASCDCDGVVIVWIRQKQPKLM
ncbi:hypothetical protein WJX73_005036 [Symbiochloris irregularis]|uniref:Uncharacterized protein n=1 Tax=Symbiochloris irregularis TaxID=706552 RepID=A0AAW1P7Y2_9CHLO